MQQLRDYLYLDLMRLEDYLSVLEPTGEIQKLSVTIHNERVQLEQKLGHPSDEGDPRQGEITTERTMSVSAKNAFNRLYAGLSDSVTNIDEKPEGVKQGFAVEVSRNFGPSPVAQKIESLPEVLRMFASAAKLEPDDEEQTMMARKLDHLLKGLGKEHDIPIIARAVSPSYSVVFLADPQYVLRGPAALTGDLTLVGKVNRIILDNHELNLLDLPNVLQRGILEGGLQVDDVAEVFADWPEELGPELDSDAFTIKGPAIVVDALAVFT